MSDSAKKDWRELCAAVASERDPRKLELLLQELIKALDNRKSQSHVPEVQTPAPNRSNGNK